ncbi:hypothetical protein ACLB2K_019855 [Fragaria x ananassa]
MRLCKCVTTTYGLYTAAGLLFYSNMVAAAGLLKQHMMFLVLVSQLCCLVTLGDNLEEINVLKQSICSKFAIKDLGHLKYFLGLRTEPSKICGAVEEDEVLLDDSEGVLGAVREELSALHDDGDVVLYLWLPTAEER